MRVFNRLFLVSFGIALAAAGVVVVIEGVSTWTNSGFVWIPGQRWLTSFKTTAWSAPIVIGISVAVGALGLILVLAELRPQRKRHASFSTDHGTWLLLRRSAETHLARRIAEQVPVTPIKVRLTPRSLRWRVKVTAKAASSSESSLLDSAQSELARLHAPSMSKVTVNTTRAGKSS